MPDGTPNRPRGLGAATAILAPIRPAVAARPDEIAAGPHGAHKGLTACRAALRIRLHSFGTFGPFAPAAARPRPKPIGDVRPSLRCLGPAEGEAIGVVAWHDTSLLGFTLAVTGWLEHASVLQRLRASAGRFVPTSDNRPPQA